MIEHYTPSHKSYSSPPNVVGALLTHASRGRKKEIEMAAFNEHRFAFYFWAKWKKENKINPTPDLITFDWHQDLVSVKNKEQLKKLDLKNLFEVSFFAWAKLSIANDNHILAAAYLDLIGDVYVVCKEAPNPPLPPPQGGDVPMNVSPSGGAVKEIIDIKGKKHFIRKYENEQALMDNIQTQNIEHLYFDIDLDYFTIENKSSNKEQRFTYMKDREIKEIFNLETPFIQWIFKRMEGLTIAFEPDYTGGIDKSMKYYNLLDKLWFA